MWRAQVRRKGQYAASTFLRRRDAETYSIEVERTIDVSNKVPKQRVKRTRTFADLVQLHVDDMKEVGQINTPVEGRCSTIAYQRFRRHATTRPDAGQIDRRRPGTRETGCGSCDDGDKAH